MNGAEIADARAAFLLVARSYFGQLYIWGGESEEEGGKDCSGYVGASLTKTARAWPDLYDGQRRTAQGIFDYYGGCEVGRPLPGCLLGWENSSGRIYHVKIYATRVPGARLSAALGPGEEILPVGSIAFDAGGGNKRTVSPKEALMRRATIGLSSGSFHGGKDWSVCVDPFLKLTTHFFSSLTSGGAFH